MRKFRKQEMLDFNEDISGNEFNSVYEDVAGKVKRIAV